MKEQGLYSINFGSLSIGNHSFNFELNDSFFESFSEAEIVNGNCKVDIQLKKHSFFLEMDVNINGEVTVECDRCLEELTVPTDFSSKLIIKFSSEINDPQFEINAEEEDIIWVNASDVSIDLTQYFFDSVSLGLPISRIHKDDENGQSGCNEDMLARFIQSQK